MSKIIELAKKIKALAESGIGGEKINAEKILNDLIIKHGLEMSDFSDEKRNEYFITIDTNHFQQKLLQQIARKISKDISIYGEFPADVIQINKLLGNHLIVCTAIEYLEISCKFDFYSKIMLDEMDVFYRAFLEANELLVFSNNRDKPISDAEVDKIIRASEMANFIPKNQFVKRID